MIILQNYSRISAFAYSELAKAFDPLKDPFPSKYLYYFFSIVCLAGFDISYVSISYLLPRKR